MRLGYLYSRYPVISQTFCDREMLALEQLGFSLVIGSIYPPHTSLRHEHLIRLRAPIQYAPPQQILRIWEKHAKASGRWPGSLVGFHQRKYGPGVKSEQRARNALYFADLFTRTGVDHFHVHFANRAAYTALFLKEISGIPFSMTAHGQDFMADLGNDDLLCEICAAAKFVAVETDYSRDLLCQRCPESAGKIHRVYNGMDLSHVPPPLPAATKPAASILSVGRLVPFKGFDQLIDACAELLRRNIDFSCQIVGDGPLRDNLQSKIDRLNLESRITLLGSLSQNSVFDKLRACDIFALPSMVDHQGASDIFPTVILEAMSAARPVVSTRLAGIPESVVHEETGILVPPGHATALAEAFERLIRDPKLRVRYGNAGRARVEQHFRIEQTVAPLVELLQSSPVAAPKSPPLARPATIAYLIDRWPDEKLPLLDHELQELKKRNIPIRPIVCELNATAQFNVARERSVEELEFLPDAMVIEAEWQANRALAQKLQEERAHEDNRVPAAIFLRQARFAVALGRLLRGKGISHLHATASGALVTALMLQRIVDLTISASIEPRPELPHNWIKSALRRCRGGRVSDQKLLNHENHSFLFDKAGSASIPKKTLLRLKEKIGIDLTRMAGFWQEWSELLMRWSREDDEAKPITRP